MIDPFLSRHLPQVKKACLNNNVMKLYAFGSIVDGRFILGKSDIDMLVEFDTKTYTKKENSRYLFKLWVELKSIFKCKVDLITNDNIIGEYFEKYLDQYKEIIYDRTEINTV